MVTPKKNVRARALKAPALILLLIVAALVFAGCNTTGLQLPATPAVAQPTATAVAQLPVATPTGVRGETPSGASEDTPTPASTDASTPGVSATLEASPTPESVPTDEPSAQPSTTAQSQPTSVAAAISPTPTVIPQAERIRVFQQVWDTVEKNYLYPDFHGADWQALHDKYLPIITNATNSHDFYSAISDMVSQLKDGHSRYLSPQDAREEDALQSGNADYVGIGVLSSPETNTLSIIFVFPGSPAEKAGIKRRDKITAVDGIPITHPDTDQSRIRGPKGSTVTLTVQSPEQKPRDVAIVRDTITGGIVPTGSRLESDPTIGLLVIPDLWTDQMGTQVHDELQQMLDDSTPLNGLILDLRGNGGGFRTVLESILSDFVSGQVGQFFNQKEHTPLVIQKSDLFDRLKSVPLVVLVDKGSESYTEVLSGVLQATGRAKVVGVTSAGNTETIYQYNFEDGSRLWVAEEAFELPNGTNLEGRGVIPDVTINQDWTTFTEKDDPHILKAVQLLKTKN
jgi:C-terminal peptidase prc